MTVALEDDLLYQSRQLAEMGVGRPKQANLRRAISSAYYAVFHLLVSEAVHSLLPGKQKRLIDRVSRAFNHGEMQSICKQFDQQNPNVILTSLLGGAVDLSIRAVASLFVALQESRHAADYDLSIRYTRTSALAHVESAELIFETWKRARKTEAAGVFLAALAFGKHWSR